MKPVTLLLSTHEDDELGRLPLADVAVAGPEENGSSHRPQLNEEMDDLEARIVSAIQAEGMAPALEPIDLRIAVGRAVLSDENATEILIRVPVREAALDPDERGRADGSDPDRPLILDGLFDLDRNDGMEEEGPDA